MFRILEWSKAIKIMVVKGIVKSKGLWSPITNTSSTASNNLSTEELEEIVTSTETLGVLPTSSSKENLGRVQVKL